MRFFQRNSTKTKKRMTQSVLYVARITFDVNQFAGRQITCRCTNPVADDRFQVKNWRNASHSNDDGGSPSNDSRLVSGTALRACFI